MRRTHNKLFYGRYTHKATFKMPWSAFLYPTTDLHLQSVIDTGFDNFTSVRVLTNDRWIYFYNHTKEIKLLSSFILENRSSIKFRIQQEQAIFYGDKKIILSLISIFWDEWRDIQTVATRKNKLPDTNTVFCKRLPLGKYQYQIYVKKNLHNLLSDRQREDVWRYLNHNEENIRIPSKQLTEYFSGKTKYGWEGYFYVKEEKMLTPLYMMSQNLIHKIYKYERI